MDQALQERLDRIEQRMDTFEEKLEQRNAELLQASAHNMRIILENSVDKKLSLILENTVMKQLKLLAEGQQTLLETLAPRSKVEDLEEDVAMLKQVVRMMSQDITELKKAQ